VSEDVVATEDPKARVIKLLETAKDMEASIIIVDESGSPLSDFFARLIELR
jgi:hypothetical protein